MTTNPDNSSQVAQEAESRLIGQIFGDNKALEEVVGILFPSDFSNSEYAEIFAAMINLEKKNQPITSLSVVEELGQQADRIGGIDHLEALQCYGAVSIRTPRQYAEMIRRQRQRRDMIRIGRALVSTGLEGPTDTTEAAESAIDQLLQMTHDPDSGNMVALYDHLAPAITAAEDAARGGTESSGVSTGFRDIDAIMGGLRPGNLILIAARPGVGKSALSMNIAANVAEHTTKTVLVFNLEMSARELVYRLVADRADLCAQRLMRGKLKSDEWPAAIAACASASDMSKRIMVLDQSYLTPAILRAHLRKEMRKRDVGLVVVDYIQLMSSGMKRENQNVEVSNISRGLKVLARDFSVPIIALSQLNRAVEGRSEGVPRLSDLRDSGSLEQDADAVIFIHKEEEHSAEANIILAKQRNGPKGRIVLSWDAKSIRFRNARDNTPPESMGGLS
jgi:replicative DNA helicase